MNLSNYSSYSREFTVDQLRALNAQDFSTISRNGLSTFSSNQIAALNAGQLNALFNSSAYQSALKTNGIYVWSTAQLQSISLTAMAGLSINAINALQLNRGRHALTDAQASRIDPNTLAGMGGAIFGALSDSNIKALALTQIAALTADQISALLDRNALGEWSTAQVRAVAASAISQIKADQLTGLGMNFSTTQIRALTPDQAKAIFKGYNRIGFLVADDSPAIKNNGAYWTASQFGALSKVAQDAAIAGWASNNSYNNEAVDYYQNLSRVDINGTLVPVFMLQYGLLSTLSTATLTKLQADTLAYLLGGASMGLVNSGLAYGAGSWNAAQIQALSPAALARVSLAYWEPAAIANLTTTQIGALSSTQINGLLSAPGDAKYVLGNIYLPRQSLGLLGGAPGWTLNQFRSLSTQAIAGLNIALLAPTSLAYLSTTQIGALTSSQMKAILTTSKLANVLSNLGGNGCFWSFDQYLSLSTDAQKTIATTVSGKVATIAIGGSIIPISFLSVQTVCGFSNAQIAALDGNSLLSILQNFPSIINIGTGTGWSPVQLQSIASGALTNLGSSISQMGSAIAWFTPAQIGALSNSQFGALLNAGSTNQIITKLSDSGASTGHWSAAQFQALNSQIFASMTFAQLELLSSQDFATMSTAQVQAIAPNRIVQMSKDMIYAFAGSKTVGSYGKISNMTAEQVKAIAPTVLSQMDINLLTYFTPKQVADLTLAQIAALSFDQVLALLNNPQFNAMFQGIGSGVLGTLSLEQYMALSGNGNAAVAQYANVSKLGTINLSPTVGVPISYLSRSILIGLSAGQISLLTPTSFIELVRFDPGLMDLWSGTQIKAVSSSALAGLAKNALLEMPEYFFASLSENQILNFWSNMDGSQQADFVRLRNDVLIVQVFAKMLCSPKNIAQYGASLWYAMNGTQQRYFQSAPDNKVMLGVLEGYILGGVNEPALQAEIKASYGSVVTFGPMQESTADDLIGMPETQISGLTEIQISEILSNPATRGIIYGVGGKDSNVWSAKQFQAISKSAMPGMGSGIALLSAAQLTLLTETQISGLTEHQISAILNNPATRGIIYGVGGKDSNVWSAKQFQAISKSAMPGMGSGIALLSAAQLTLLTETQISGLTEIQISAILNNPATRGIIYGVGGKDSNVWSAKQFQAISKSAMPGMGSGIALLSAAQLTLLTETQISGLTEIQISAILNNPATRGIIYGVGGKDSNVWSAKQFQAISKSAMPGIGSDIALLSAAQLTLLTETQISGLTEHQISAILGGWVIDGQAANLTTQKMSALLDNLDIRDVVLDAGSGNINVWSIKQFQAISKVAIGGIDFSRAWNFRKELLDCFTEEQISGLSGWQLHVIMGKDLGNVITGIWGGVAWSDNQFLALSRESMFGFEGRMWAIKKQLPLLTETQISGLTEIQISEILSNPATRGIIYGVGGKDSNVWSAKQFQAISKSAMPGMGSGIALLSAAQLTLLTETQISGLTEHQISAILNNPATRGIIYGVGGKDSNVWSAKQFQAISKSAMPGMGSGIALLSAAQLTLLTETQISGLTEIQISAILNNPATRGIIYGVGGKDSNVWSAKQFQAISKSAMPGIGSDIALLSAAQLTLLTETQISGLTEIQISEILSNPATRDVIFLSSSKGDGFHWSGSQMTAISLDLMRKIIADFSPPINGQLPPNFGSFYGDLRWAISIKASDLISNDSGDPMIVDGKTTAQQFQLLMGSNPECRRQLFAFLPNLMASYSQKEQIRKQNEEGIRDPIEIPMRISNPWFAKPDCSDAKRVHDQIQALSDSVIASLSVAQLQEGYVLWGTLNSRQMNKLVSSPGGVAKMVALIDERYKTDKYFYAWSKETVSQSYAEGVVAGLSFDTAKKLDKKEICLLVASQVAELSRSQARAISNWSKDQIQSIWGVDGTAIGGLDLGCSNAKFLVNLSADQLQLISVEQWKQLSYSDADILFDPKGSLAFDQAQQTAISTALGLEGLDLLLKWGTISEEWYLAHQLKSEQAPSSARLLRTSLSTNLAKENFIAAGTYGSGGITPLDASGLNSIASLIPYFTAKQISAINGDVFKLSNFIQNKNPELKKALINLDNSQLYLLTDTNRNAIKALSQYPQNLSAKTHYGISELATELADPVIKTPSQIRMSSQVIQVARSIGTSSAFLELSPSAKAFWAEETKKGLGLDIPASEDQVKKYIDVYKNNIQRYRTVAIVLQGSAAAGRLYQQGGVINNIQATAFALQFLGPAISGYAILKTGVDLTGSSEHQWANEAFNLLNLTAAALKLHETLASGNASDTEKTSAILSVVSGSLFVVSEFPQKEWYMMASRKAKDTENLSLKTLGWLAKASEKSSWLKFILKESANINAIGQTVLSVNILFTAANDYISQFENMSESDKIASGIGLGFTAIIFLATAILMVVNPAMAPWVAVAAMALPDFKAIGSANDLKITANRFSDTQQTIMSNNVFELYRIVAISAVPLIGPMVGLALAPKIKSITEEMSADDNAKTYEAAYQYERWVKINSREALAANSLIRAALGALASGSSQTFNFVLIDVRIFNAREYYMGGDEELGYVTMKNISNSSNAYLTTDKLIKNAGQFQEVSIKYDKSSSETNLDIVVGSGFSKVKLLLDVSQFEDSSSAPKANTIEVLSENVTVIGNGVTIVKVDVTDLYQASLASKASLGLVMKGGVYGVYLDDIRGKGTNAKHSFNLDLLQDSSQLLPFVIYGFKALNSLEAIITSNTKGVRYYADPLMKETVTLSNGGGGHEVRIGGAGCKLVMGGVGNTAYIVMHGTPNSGASLGSYDGGGTGTIQLVQSAPIDTNAGFIDSLNIADFSQSDADSYEFISSSSNSDIEVKAAKTNSSYSEGGNLTHFQQLTTGLSNNAITLNEKTGLQKINLIGAKNTLNFSQSLSTVPQKNSEPFFVSAISGVNTINLSDATWMSYVAVEFGAGVEDASLRATIEADSFQNSLLFSDYGLTRGGEAVLKLNAGSTSSLSLNGGNHNEVFISSSTKSGAINILDRTGAERTSSTKLEIKFADEDDLHLGSLKYSFFDDWSIGISKNNDKSWMTITPGGLQDCENIFLSGYLQSGDQKTISLDSFVRGAASLYKSAPGFPTFHTYQQWWSSSQHAP